MRLFLRGDIAKSRALTALVIAASVLAPSACSHQNAQPPPTPAALLHSIPSADPSKYADLSRAKHWENPYLAIRAEAVALLSSANPNEEQILKPEQVLNALAQLPASAWPYGRVVAILLDEKPASTEADKVAIRRSRGIVEGDLRSAAVEIHWIGESQ